MPITNTACHGLLEDLYLLGCIWVVPCWLVQVYEMSPDTATQQWQQRLLYMNDGGIATTGTDGVLAVHHVRH